MQTTRDIFELFKRKYNFGEFRTIGNDVQQSKTIEIQNAHFEADKGWIVRQPNYDYIHKEIEWYKTQSLNVNDIPGGAPKMWKACATPLGYINSNYGWCIFSKDNGEQFEYCKKRLIADPYTREAIMIYNRPSMQQEFDKDGMHDFMCCQNVQYFVNGVSEDLEWIDCIVNFRSCDAVFGFNNDFAWMRYVLNRLVEDLAPVWKEKGKELMNGHIYWNAGSLHIYERHFDILMDPKTTETVNLYCGDTEQTDIY